MFRVSQDSFLVFDDVCQGLFWGAKSTFAYLPEYGQRWHRIVLGGSGLGLEMLPGTPSLLIMVDSGVAWNLFWGFRLLFLLQDGSVLS